MLHRVWQALTAGQRRDGILRLKLHPPELGALRLQIRWKEGGLTARLEAERPEVYSLLLDGLEQLRHRLETQQIRVEKFEVVLNSGENLAGEQPASDRSQTPVPSWTSPTGGKGTEPRHSPSQSAETQAVGILEDGRVDVRI